MSSKNHVNVSTDAILNEIILRQLQKDDYSKGYISLLDQLSPRDPNSTLVCNCCRA